MTHLLSARHALVGASLRQYRENLGYSLGDAARILGCDPSKISRIETAQRGIRPFELRALLREYDVDASTQDTLAALIRPGTAKNGWYAYRTVLSTGYLDFTAAEGVATEASVYAPLLIPELLRTPAYARALVAADPLVPGDHEDLVMDAILARQQARLVEQRLPLTVILGEAALHQQVGGCQVLSEQLTRLAELDAKHEQITIRILPFTLGAHAASGSDGFSLLHFSKTPSLGLVHVAGPGGGSCLDDPTASSIYHTIFTQLSVSALDAGQSAQKLRQLAQHRARSLP
jgi:transcriptional regulator with XRE-family HTH domain